MITKQIKETLPWRLALMNNVICRVESCRDDNRFVAELNPYQNRQFQQEDIDNGFLIVAACNAFPKLLELVDEYYAAKPGDDFDHTMWILKVCEAIKLSKIVDVSDD